MPWTLPRRTVEDLRWWQQILSEPVERAISEPGEFANIQAYFNASSTVGIGIIIRKRWRAWKLKPGWKKPGRDIRWAEAVGFLLLVTMIAKHRNEEKHIRVFGDNKGVVEGW